MINISVLGNEICRYVSVVCKIICAVYVLRIFGWLL